MGFDCYVIGYCISHFDERWELHVDDSMEIDLLVKGVRSSSVVKGMIWHLSLSLQSLSFSQIITQIREFCGLDVLDILYYQGLYIFSDDDGVILQQLIAPWSGLRRLAYSGGDGTNDDELNFISLMFQPSSLQVLDLYVSGEDIVLHELLPHKNTNLEVLRISSNLLRPLAALIVNITSLIYLEINSATKHVPDTIGPLDSDLPVLTNIVQSHCTLEELHVRVIEDSTDPSTNLLQLIEAAGNNQLKKLRLHESDYDKLPPHIRKQYKHLVKRRGRYISSLLY